MKLFAAHFFFTALSLTLSSAAVTNSPISCLGNTKPYRCQTGYMGEHVGGETCVLPHVKADPNVFRVRLCCAGEPFDPDGQGGSEARIGKMIVSVSPCYIYQG